MPSASVWLPVQDTTYLDPSTTAGRWVPGHLGKQLAPKPSKLVSMAIKYMRTILMANVDIKCYLYVQIFKFNLIYRSRDKAQQLLFAIDCYSKGLKQHNFNYHKFVARLCQGAPQIFLHQCSPRAQQLLLAKI